MSTHRQSTETDTGETTPAKQDASHHRSDSTLSMDSFVRIQDIALGQDDLTTTPPGKLLPQETIDRSPAAVQPSFQSLLHAHNAGVGSDSDTVGEGSVIFTYDLNAPALNERNLPPGGVTASRPIPTTPARDRFPSYDSAGSSGSVVRKVIGASGGKSQPPIGHPAHPKILPYHERRKLMQQRQQQQQQQVSSRGPPRSTKLSQPPTPPHPPSPSLAPPNTSSPHFASLGGGNLEHGNPLLYATSDFLPETMPIASVLPSEDAQKKAESFRQPSFDSAHRLDDPRHGSQEPFPFHHDVNVQTQESWETEDPRNFMPKPLANTLPHHIGGNIVADAHASVNQWYTSSSFDSLTDLERPPNNTDDLADPRGGTIESSESELHPEPKHTRIPPPPPPPNPTTHAYRDSMGSFSSLGSLDRSAANRGGGGEKGFFPQVYHWVSPAAKSQSTLSVADVHRGAYVDDFLSKYDRRDFVESSDLRHISPRAPMTTYSHPPTSRGGHRRLNSIENDDWSESNDGSSDVPLDSSSRRAKRLGSPQSVKFQKQTRNEKIYNNGSTSHTRPHRTGEYDNVLQQSDERTKLLPPSGISSNEYADRYRNYTGQSYIPLDNSRVMSSSRGLCELARPDSQDPRRVKKVKRSAKSAKRRSSRKNRYFLSDESSESPTYASIPSSDRDQKHMNSEEWILQGQQWKRDRRPRHQEHRSMGKQDFSRNRSSNMSDPSRGRLIVIPTVVEFLIWMESFIANLPLSIGAIALSIANLGVVWFKFAEVNLSSCTPVHFHSSQCSFPEFPGCFYCDTTDSMYRVAEYFHFCCSCFAGILALSFIVKLILAQRVVVDELSSPTTISPAGFICMTLDVVFAGRGLVGEVVVCSSAFAHLCLAVWFLYLAMAYHMLPEPSWFPATTGLGIPAIKVWLYYPMAGHFILSIALSLMFVFFPISVIRVFLNQKISATIGWMQMSAPDVALYAVTIMAQPSFQEENPDINHFQRLHRHFYLPFMSFLFFLCLLGAFASVYSLCVRWNDYSKLPFSHAHAAFCAPALSHANAVQAYRSAVQTFSGLPSTSNFLFILYAYWLVTLIGGTFITVYITTKYLLSLPRWTHFDIENDIEPPAPYQTAMSLASMVSSGDALVQPFVSPAILQANEAGALVFTRDSHGAVKYARTRKVTALGFEPIMDSIEVDLEREFLLDWVTRNAPRRRNRTLSVPPGIAFVNGVPFGSGHVGVYSGMEDSSVRSSSSRRRHERSVPQRQRAFTVSPQVRAKHSTETAAKNDRAY